MTNCCRSIVTRVSRESLIGEAPFTNQEISQYPYGAVESRLTPFSQAGMIRVL